jgi:hypothetical protein
MRAGPWPAGRPAGPLTALPEGWRRVRGAPGVLAAAFALSAIGVPAFYYLLQVYILGQFVVGWPTITVDVPAWSVVLTLLLALVWTALFGGIIDRYARPDGATTQRFFEACRKYAWPMMLVSLIAGVAYTLAEIVQQKLLVIWLFDVMSPILPPGPYEEHTETQRRLNMLPIYLSSLPIYAVHVLTDLTRINLVADDRRSVWSAVAAGWRLLTASPVAVLGVYVLGILVFAVWSNVLSAVISAVPGADGASVFDYGHWLLLAVVRALVDMLMLATLVALYQTLTARGALAVETVADPALVPEASAALAKE